jgi:hypothetical protein
MMANGYSMSTLSLTRTVFASQSTAKLTLARPATNQSSNLGHDLMQTEMDQDDLLSLPDLNERQSRVSHACSSLRMIFGFA